MNRLSSLLYITYFSFALQYRKTMVGPLWVVMGPTLFITTLGLLFAKIGNTPIEVFLPHLTVGFVTWTLMSGFVIGSTTVFRRAKAQIMQGGMSIVDIVTVDVFRTIVMFLHQIIIIVVVLNIYDVPFTLNSLLSLLGFLILVANGAWLTMLFGMLGARYRDLQEVITAVMRIAFLATPIIWMPFSSGGRGGVMSAFLTYNPFYHFLEIVRAPLLGNPIAEGSWSVVLAITALGFLVTYLFYRRVGMRIALWV